MAYFRHLLCRSFRDTWALVVALPFITASLAIAIACLTFFFTILWKDKKDVTDYLEAGGIDLLSTIIVFTVVYIAYFLFFTPKALIEESQTETKNALKRIAIFEEREKPCIELLECAPQAADGDRGRVFLLGIKNTSANDIEQCSVRLTNIKTKTRDVPCNDDLTFQPSEREPSTKRTLHPNDLNLIDVIFLFPNTLDYLRPGTKVNNVVHYWNKSEPFRNIFREMAHTFSPWQLQEGIL